MTPRRRRALAALAALLLGPWALLLLLAAFTPMPPALRPGAAPGSTRVLDRQGRLLRHARAGDGTWMLRASLDDLGPLVPAAVLAAEDRRFFFHPGVDPLAIARAAGQLVLHRRVVSGASTLTQQLARTLVPRPRTFAGKISEMALAIRLEMSLSKREIFEEYLSRIPFGPTVRGVEAASRGLFDRPARELSLAEAALLAGLPQSPTHHDPRKNLERSRRRRDLILGRMVASGAVTPAQADLALREAISLTRFRPAPLAPHFIDSLLAGPLSPGPAAEITSTLDPDLQRIAEEAARRAVEQLADRDVSAAAILVLDNDTGDILAYVGSPSVLDVKNLGANDGVRARRQPGSSLKPFVYGLAFERLSWTPATLLPDVEMTFPEAGGSFAPHNYDGKFHGPVRLREALGSSLNVPAVWAASRLGPELILEKFHDLGLASLDQPADHYGVAIALGDGEVTLIELARAYTALARGGDPVAPRGIRNFRTIEGAVVEPPAAVAPRALAEATAAQLTDILADPRARIGAFGAHSVLEFTFPVAAKTGTSKGFRDNLTVGYTREVTVAVWVGNFDGRPMRDVSGITGAGPIFHEVMLAAMAGREPRKLASVPVETRAICPLSGRLVGPDCPPGRDERFLPGQAPTEPCSMHRRLPVDQVTGLLAGRRCPPAEVRERTFEIFPASFLAWARAAGRPLPPRQPSPRCPEGAPPVDELADAPDGPRITAPPPGTLLLLDPQLQGRQEVTIQVEAPGASRVVLRVGDERHTLAGPPFSFRWPLRVGEIRLVAEASGQRSPEVLLRVQ